VTFAMVDGVWSAETADLPEWMGVGDTFGDALKLAGEALTLFLEEPVRIVPMIVGTSTWPGILNGGDLQKNLGRDVVPRAA
jgi:hypothetical protein